MCIPPVWYQTALSNGFLLGITIRVLTHLPTCGASVFQGCKHPSIDLYSYGLSRAGSTIVEA